MVIVYDRNVRLRVRFGAYAFDFESAEGIKEYFENLPYVKEVKVNSANGSVFAVYEEGHREELISELKNLNPKDFRGTGRRVESPAGKIFKLVLKKALVRLIFPLQARSVFTILRSLPFLKEGLSLLLKGHIGVEVLDAASITAAMLTGRFDTASNVMMLLNASEILEESAMERARRSLGKSLEIHAEKVWALEDGEEVIKNFSEVFEGDVLIFRSGSMILADGEVVEGQAMVNEATMTGEPLAVEKSKGSRVFAGTVIEEGDIRVRVIAVHQGTRISQIVSLVSEAEARKSETQKWAERLADRMVPYSFLIAAATYALTASVTKAVSVLMVDYSCAIRLFTPMAVLSAMREASENNMVVKGGKYFEELAKADTAVFDKTGTLTTALPKLLRAEAYEGYSEREVLKIAACLEEHFPHSVARAVVDAAAERGITHKEEHLAVEYIVAHGIASTLYGERVLIGSRHFVEDDEKAKISEEARRAVGEAQGTSVLYLAKGGKVIGLLFIEDPPRPEAREVISELKNSGFKEVIMLTGDGKETARRVASDLNVDSYEAEVLPDEKYKIVEALRAEGKCVLMAGDGINDSPALSAANVSVTMKDASDIARESADITLLSGDLRDILVLRKMSEALTLKINKTNRFIFGFNTALILLGVFGVLSPVATSVLHNFSTFALASVGMQPILKKIE